VNLDLRRLFRSFLVYGLGQGLMRLLSLLLLPVFTAVLTPEDYGISSLLGVLGLFVTPLFSLGIGGAMAPCYYGPGEHRRATTIWTATAVMCSGAALLAAGAMTASPMVSLWLFQTADHAGLVRLSLFTAAAGIVATPFMLYLQFEERAAAFVTLAAASTLLILGFSVLFVVILGGGVRGLVLAGLVGQVLSTALWAVPVVRGVPPRVSRAVARELIRVGLALVPAFALVFVIQHGNKYLLQWFHGLGPTGTYTIGANFALPLGLLVAAFTTAWTPYFMSYVDRPDEARVAFGRITTYYVYGFGILSLMFYAGARVAVLSFTQAPFHEAYRVVGAAATANVLTGLVSVLLPPIYFANAVPVLTIVQAVAAALAMVLGLAVIPPFGMTGAAVALAGAHVAHVLVQHTWNRSRGGYLQIDYEWSRLRRFALLYAACAVALSWPRNFPAVAEAGLAIASIVALLGWGWALLPEAERTAAVAVLKESPASLRRALRAGAVPGNGGR
jgi:O-antigen/teichoic acid export membrane protein